MGLALGYLHWTPAAFWTSTPHELFSALDVLSPAEESDDG
jgi:hypothetical protein